jgi:hypothetical protein
MARGDRIGPVTQGRLVRRLLEVVPLAEQSVRQGAVVLDQRGPLARSP